MNLYGCSWAFKRFSHTHTVQFLISNPAFLSWQVETGEGSTFRRILWWGFSRIQIGRSHSNPLADLRHTRWTWKERQSFEKSEIRLKLCWLKSFAKATAWVELCWFLYIFDFLQLFFLRMSRSFIPRTNMWLMICELFRKLSRNKKRKKGKSKLEAQKQTDYDSLQKRSEKTYSICVYASTSFFWWCFVVDESGTWDDDKSKDYYKVEDEDEFPSQRAEGKVKIWNVKRFLR